MRMTQLNVSDTDNENSSNCSLFCSGRRWPLGGLGGESLMFSIFRAAHGHENKTVTVSLYDCWQLM